MKGYADKYIEVNLSNGKCLKKRFLIYKERFPWRPWICRKDFVGEVKRVDPLSEKNKDYLLQGP